MIGVDVLIKKAHISFRTHLMVLLDDEAQAKACFGPFEDRCMVCAKRTIGSKIVLHAPDGTPR